MDFKVTFKQMESSPALTDYARRKVLEAVEKYVPNPIGVHLRFSHQNDQNIASCYIHGGHGFNIAVMDSGQAMYACIDGLVSKLATRLRRKKEKLRFHGRRLDFKNIRTMTPESASQTPGEELQFVTIH